MGSMDEMCVPQVRVYEVLSAWLPNAVDNESGCQLYLLLYKSIDITRWEE